MSTKGLTQRGFGDGGAEAGVQVAEAGAVGADLDDAEAGGGGEGGAEFGWGAGRRVGDVVAGAEGGQVGADGGGEDAFEAGGVFGGSLFQQGEDAAAVVVEYHDGE